MKLAEFVATAGGLGHIRIAPGTFGSIPGLFLALITRFYLVNIYSLDFKEYILASTGIGFVLCLIAHWSISKIEKKWPHDDSRIVIDEVAGQYFATVYFSLTWYHALASFILFRFFDIWKPWPIRWVDKEWHSCLATLVDDLMASVLAIACLAGLCTVLA